MFHSHIDICSGFVFLVLVNAVFDEHTLERGVEQAFAQFVKLDFKFAPEDVARAVGTMAQHVAHTQKVRFLFRNHAAVGRNTLLAIGKGVEGVDGFVARRSGQQMHHYACVLGGIVLNLADFDFALFKCLEYGINYGSGGFAIWYLGDGQCTVVDFLDFCADAYGTSATPVVVTADVDGAACRKVRKEFEFLAAQIRYCSV